MIQFTVLTLWNSLLVFLSLAARGWGAPYNLSSPEQSESYSELLLNCFNGGSDSGEPSDFRSFLSGRPVDLRLERVWWTRKRSPLPITLFTMASLDRLPLLESQCRSYPGPISAALYLPLTTANKRERQRKGPALDRSSASSQHEQPNWAAQIQSVAIRLQALFNRLESIPTACAPVIMLFSERVSDSAIAALMPTNALRNAAMLPVQTPLSAMVDADLSASSGLTILASDGSRIQTLLAAAKQDRVLWVMPAWETKRELDLRIANRLVDAALASKTILARLWLGDSSSLYHDAVTQVQLATAEQQVQQQQPQEQTQQEQAQQQAQTQAQTQQQTQPGRRLAAGAVEEVGLAELRRQQRALLGEQRQNKWANSSVYPFDFIDFPNGHGATDFMRFLRDDKPYAVKYSEGYEPWFITASELFLPYDERFRGWYGDKFSQVLHSVSRGRKFVVLPDVWLIHRPHPPAAARALYRRESGSPTKDVDALSEVMTWRFLPKSKFQHYMVRVRNLEFRERQRLPVYMYKPQMGEGFKRCRDMLPWWKQLLA